MRVLVAAATCRHLSETSQLIPNQPSAVQLHAPLAASHSPRPAHGSGSATHSTAFASYAAFPSSRATHSGRSVALLPSVTEATAAVHAYRV